MGTIKTWKANHKDSIMLLQFSSSAYIDFNYDEENQTKRLLAILEPYENQDLFAGVVLEEWTDQWWKGDIDEYCSSTKFQPYYQSNCSISYFGMASQKNIPFGQHCIKLRPAINKWREFFGFD